MRSGSTRTTDGALRRWVAAAASSLRLVADRPALWLAGGLAWLTTVGWLPFVLAVVSLPGEGELPYLGSGFWTSGLWPLNALLLAAAAVAVVVLALTLASAGNAVLVASAEGRAPSTRETGSLLVMALLGALPVAVCVLAIGIATVMIGPAEFNRPDVESSALLRIAVRIAPLLVFTGALTIVASTLAGLAGRAAMQIGRADAAIAVVPELARRAGRAGLVHVVIAVAVGVLTILLAGSLLAVLWAPIRAGLSGGGILDLAGVLLLVGFVAIWLCLVLAGGAVHAWASVTATMLLGREGSRVADRPQEMLIDR